MELAFPNHENAPAVAGQLFRVLSISRLVAAQLWEPVIDARFRHSTAIAMMMPETAMHEYDGATRRKYEVGTAGQIAPMEPIAIAERMH